MPSLAPLVNKAEWRTWLREQQRQERSKGHQASYEEDGQREAAGLLVQLPDAKVAQEGRKGPQHLDQRKACAITSPLCWDPHASPTRLAHAFLASLPQWTLAVTRLRTTGHTAAPKPYVTGRRRASYHSAQLRWLYAPLHAARAEYTLSPSSQEGDGF